MTNSRMYPPHVMKKEIERLGPPLQVGDVVQIYRRTYGYRGEQRGTAVRIPPRSLVRVLQTSPRAVGAVLEFLKGEFRVTKLLVDPGHFQVLSIVEQIAEMERYS